MLVPARTSCMTISVLVALKNEIKTNVIVIKGNKWGNNGVIYVTHLAERLA